MMKEKHSKKDLYRISQIGKKVRRLLFKRLGVSEPPRGDVRSGLCGLAAMPLCAELRNGGYGDAIIVSGHVRVDLAEPDCRSTTRSKYWVEIDGLVIDIMADQFNYLLRGQKFPAILLAPYDVLPRYKARSKDAIKIGRDTQNFLGQWLDSI